MQDNLKREEIHIDRNVLREIIYDIWFSKKADYKIIENKIVSSDLEDGGADHEVVIERIVDNKFFYFEYSDWDMDYNFERDFPENLKEVFPKEKTVIIYE